MNIALKTVLAMSLLKHLKEKTEEVLASDQRLQKCLEVGWLVQTENALVPSWVYPSWDPVKKCQIVAPDPPLKHTECLRRTAICGLHVVLSALWVRSEILEQQETGIFSTFLFYF